MCLCGSRDDLSSLVDEPESAATSTTSRKAESEDKLAALGKKGAKFQHIAHHTDMLFCFLLYASFLLLSFLYRSGNCLDPRRNF